MGRRTNFAPTATTIIIALVLTLVGLLGTSGHLFSDRIGIIAYVLAIGILLVGMVTRRL